MPAAPAAAAAAHALGSHSDTCTPCHRYRVVRALVEIISQLLFGLPSQSPARAARRCAGAGRAAGAPVRRASVAARAAVVGGAEAGLQPLPTLPSQFRSPRYTRCCTRRRRNSACTVALHAVSNCRMAGLLATLLTAISTAHSIAPPKVARRHHARPGAAPVPLAGSRRVAGAAVGGRGEGGSRWRIAVAVTEAGAAGRR